jgi:hypothetical protein
MHYIYESILVGLYSCIICALISPLLYKYSLIILFFVVGFIKHFIGYYLLIHQYYCKYKYNVIKKYNKSILVESILEGSLFVIIGYTVSLYLKNILLNIFIIGTLLHIIFEILGFHKTFCYNLINI